MKISDLPGRLLAILILGPYLIYKGYIIKDNILIFLGAVSLLYELLWVLNIKPNIVTL